jgi:spoIIIJ-associated protein
METMEFEGKTTEEAIHNASNYLNIPVEELDIDIIEPGSAGIFGLVGTKKARIKVTYTPARDQIDEGIFPADEADFKEEEDEKGVEAEAGGMPELPENKERELELAKETLERILQLIPMEATVDAKRSDGNIYLNIEGDNSGLLIGRRGKTLDAIQFIVNKIVNKELDKKIRVVVDSERYRQRRKDSLTQLAMRMGEKARRIGKPVTTNPMNPSDRRTVHMALKDQEDLETRSRGEGLMKKVVIIPKK